MKKILIIIYYWPPSGGSGVQRWLKFVKYLPQFGWLPTVITTKNGDYPNLDFSLENEIPANIKVIRTKTPVFGKLFKKLAGKNSSIPHGSLEIQNQDNWMKKILIFCRINFVIPDMRKIWNKHAFKVAKLELKSNKYDAIITSGPPHSTHLVGYKLKRKLGVKWIADFRDPWTEIGYLKNVKRCQITSFADRILENRVVRNSNHIIVAADEILKSTQKIKKTLITNGFDESDFKTKKKSSKQFTINYFGIIPPERSPLPLLKAISKMSYHFQHKIIFNIYGNVCHPIREQLQNYDFAKSHKYIPHEKMMPILLNSSILLLIVNSVENIIPGKIFEYLGAKIPILGIGPENSEVAKILEKTDSGKMFNYYKIDEIGRFIENVHNKKIEFSFKDVEKYGRKNLTKKLAEVLKELTT